MLGRARLAARLLAAGSALPGSAPIPIDSAGQLHAMLPGAVAERVLQTIAGARAQQLPAEALEYSALELAAEGVAPEAILRQIETQHAELAAAREALVRGGRETSTGEEIEAAATALGRGVGGAAVSELAKSAPAGRSLAAPFFVVASMANRGVPADDAVAAVQSWLRHRATDAELQALARRQDATACSRSL